MWKWEIEEPNGLNKRKKTCQLITGKKVNE